MYFLTVLEARSLRSRCCWQGWLLLRLWLGIWSKSPSFRWCWKSLLFFGLSIYHPDFCLHSHMPFSLCACLWIKVSLLYKGTSPIGLGSTLSVIRVTLPVWPHLNCYICNDIRSCSEVLEIRRMSWVDGEGKQFSPSRNWNSRLCLSRNG